MPRPRSLAILLSCAALAAACDSPTDPPLAAPRMLITRETGANVDIYSILPDGTEPVRITSEPFAENCPRWSRDRRRIAYVSNRDSLFAGGQWRRAMAVYVADADGSNPVRLTQPNATYATGCADWSPDGTRLVYDRYSAEVQRFAVYLLQADGSGETRLTNTDGADDFGARWSPDGSRILFTTTEGSGWWRMRTISPDGTARREIPSPCFANVYDATWSPDGTRVAYTCDSSWGTQVRTSKVDGTEPVLISAQVGPERYGDDFAPLWSPDGQRIALARSADASYDIFTVDLTGGSPVRVTATPGTEMAFDWR